MFKTTLFIAVSDCKERCGPGLRFAPLAIAFTGIWFKIYRVRLKKAQLGNTSSFMEYLALSIKKIMEMTMVFARITFVVPLFIIGVLSGFIPAYADANQDCPQQRNTLKAPKKIFKKKNPLRSTQKNISAGQELYFQVRKELGCVRCHGPAGDGKGDMSAGLEPPPRNFSCAAMMNKIPDGQLFWIIKNGSANTAMYSYDKLKDKDVWQLVLFIRQFSKK